MPTQSKTPAVDPAAYELRQFIKDSNIDISKLGVKERKFLANYLRIKTSVSCEGSSRLAKTTGQVHSP